MKYLKQLCDALTEFNKGMKGLQEQLERLALHIIHLIGVGLIFYHVVASKLGWQ